jgi:uncharacterized protein involved in exopolysaccharide biosynthesis
MTKAELQQIKSELAQANGVGGEKQVLTLRDFASVFFRHRKLALWSFLGAFIGATLVVGIFVANRYKAEMKILVGKERSDPVVSAGRPNEQIQQLSDSVSESDVNTEVALLQDDDLLREVVLANGLQNDKTLHDYLLFFWPLTPEERVDKAVINLKKAMNVAPEPKTNLIDVSYVTYFNRQKSAKILNSLQGLYLAKHLEVHVPHGAQGFFEEQTQAYKKNLENAEARLQEYSEDSSAVSPQLERDASVQNMVNFDANLKQTQAAIKETTEKIRKLDQQLASTPDRVKTLDHVSDPILLLQQDNTTLLNLELQRSDLLTKYDPEYPLVKNVDRQIAQAKAALDHHQQTPVRDTTTDHDPTYELIREDLAKAQELLAALKGLEAGNLRAINQYRASTVALEQKSIAQQDLLREVKANEDNYLLYLHKQEESRVENALNAGRFANVAVAQQAAIPALPAFSPMLGMLLAAICACMVSVGSVYTAELLNDTFRTPDELKGHLDVPVLASLPETKG